MSGERGQMAPQDATSDFDADAFQIRQQMYRMNTCTLVMVVTCTNVGGLSKVGRVDIHPLVNQVDGNKIATPHGTIYNVPYFRYQGGANAIILDPKPGDIGMVAFADHDISSVVATGAQANPGTARRFAMADALYLGSFLGGEPTQWIRFSEEGIEIHSPTQIKFDAPDIDLEAQTVEINATTSCTITTPTFTVNGDTILNGGISQGAGGSGGTVSLIGPATVAEDLTANGVSTSGHKHPVPGIQPGGSTVESDPPG